MSTLDVLLTPVSGKIDRDALVDALLRVGAIMPFATVADAEAADIDADVGAIMVAGHTTSGDGGRAYYDRVASEPSHAFKLQSNDGAWWEGMYEFGLRAEVFGAIGELVEPPTVNRATELQNFFDYAAEKGGFYSMPRGCVRLGSQVTATFPGTSGGTATEGNLGFFGYGCTLFTDAGASISALQVEGGANIGGGLIEGLKVNARGNGDQTAGIDLVGTRHITLRNIVAEAYSTRATWAGIRMRQSDVNDTGTGCFWTQIVGFQMRKRSGSDGGTGVYMNAGIRSEGQNNATLVTGGSISHATSCIQLTTAVGGGNLANAFRVDNVAFETYTQAFELAHDTGAGGYAIAGFHATGCRYESGDHIVLATGTPAYDSNSRKVRISNSFYIGSAYGVSKVSNAAGVTINFFDTDDVPGSDPPVDLTFEGMSLTAAQTTDWLLTAVPAGGSRGVRIRNSGDSANAVALTWTGTGNNGSIHSDGNIAYRNVNTVSRNSTTRNNGFSFVQISDTDSTATVTFGTAEPNATYYVFTGPLEATTGSPTISSLWITNKTVNGFTFNLGSPPGAGTTLSIPYLVVGY